MNDTIFRESGTSLRNHIDRKYRHAMTDRTNLNALQILTFLSFQFTCVSAVNLRFTDSDQANDAVQFLFFFLKEKNFLLKKQPL